MLTDAPPRRTTSRPPRGPCRPHRGVDHLVGTVEERPVERAGRDVHGADVRAAAAGDRDDRQTDPTAADDEHGVTVADGCPYDHRSVGRGHAAPQTGRHRGVEAGR